MARRLPLSLLQALPLTSSGLDTGPVPVSGLAFFLATEGQHVGRAPGHVESDDGREQRTSDQASGPVRTVLSLTGPDGSFTRLDNWRAVYLFPIATVPNYLKLGGLNSTNLCHSGGQKSEVSLTGLQPRCWQSWFLLGAPGENPISSRPRTSYHIAFSPPASALTQLSSSSVVVFSLCLS